MYMSTGSLGNPDNTNQYKYRTNDAALQGSRTTSAQRNGRKRAHNIRTNRNHKKTTRQMGNKKIAEESAKLQHAEDQNNTKPLWEYRNKLRSAIDA